MNKVIQILFFVLIPLVGFGQEKKDSTTTQSKWSLQLLGGSTYTFPTYPTEADIKGKGLYKYGFAILINRKIGKYTITNFGVSHQFLKYNTWLAGRPSGISNFDYSFINIITSIRFISNHGKIRANLDLGLSGNFLMDNNHYYNDAINHIHTSSFANGSFITSLFFATGINYQVNRKFTINLMCGYSKAITPLKYEYDIGLGPRIRINYVQYLMINTGVQYYFK
ncbi:MAG: hypothetical protein AABZ74_11965 [Cyanobacteriota bacterium]